MENIEISLDEYGILIYTDGFKFYQNLKQRGDLNGI